MRVYIYKPPNLNTKWNSTFKYIKCMTENLAIEEKMNNKTYSPIYNIQLNQTRKNELQIWRNNSHTQENAVIICSPLCLCKPIYCFLSQMQSRSFAFLMQLVCLTTEVKSNTNTHFHDAVSQTFFVFHWNRKQHVWVWMYTRVKHNDRQFHLCVNSLFKWNPLESKHRWTGHVACMANITWPGPQNPKGTF